jgi:hypothetical protein
MSGLCGSDPTGDEELQWRALNASVRELLPCGTTTDPDWYDVVQYCHSDLDTWLNLTRKLGGFAKDGQTTYEGGYIHFLGEEYGWLRLGMELRSGSVHVTMLIIHNFGLDLTHLTRLLQGLPSLEVLEIENCVNYGPSMGVSIAHNASARTLPSSLPLVSPNLTKFLVRSSNLIGTLPGSFGRWTQMKYIDLFNNNLTGSIPQVRQHLERF